MKKILYIHGFASVGNSYKGKLLIDEFGEERVISPTFSHKPENAIEEIEAIIKKEDLVLVGTSLGGFYTDYFNVKYSIPGLVINPLVDPEVVRKYIGENRNFYTNEIFDFSLRDFNKLKDIKLLKESLPGYGIRVAQEIILLAKDDELLDYRIALKEFSKPGQDLRVYPDGGHRFTKSREIIDAVKTITLELRG